MASDLLSATGFTSLLLRRMEFDVPHLSEMIAIGSLGAESVVLSFSSYHGPGHVAALRIPNSSGDNLFTKSSGTAATDQYSHVK